MTGMFAISKAGHDKGQMYIIMKEEEDFVYLVDGKSKKTENPKKKRKKHIQIVKTGTDKALLEKIKNGQKIYDEEIKFAIKLRTKKQEVVHVKG
ncbi:MAG: KOW domain-containing RNA-binding protein [Clostridium sp.]|nr:KOW domain-containing RNA-binding protein [Clostridium sp.]